MGEPKLNFRGCASDVNRKLQYPAHPGLQTLASNVERAGALGGPDSPSSAGQAGFNRATSTVLRRVAWICSNQSPVFRSILMQSTCIGLRVNTESKYGYKPHAIHLSAEPRQPLEHSVLAVFTQQSAFLSSPILCNSSKLEPLASIKKTLLQSTGLILPLHAVCAPVFLFLGFTIYLISS